MAPSGSGDHQPPGPIGEQAATSPAQALPGGGGEMGQRIRAFDWAATPLGPMGQWPQSLQTAVRLMLHSRYPMFVWWGREFINLYNDAYIPVLGARHPAALGRSAPGIWAEIWPVVGPQAELVFQSGEATWNEAVLLTMERHGFREESYFTFSYSPAPDDQGGVGGVFCACIEDTARVLSERRLKTLRDLGERSLAEVQTAEAACRAAARTIGENNRDFAFALVYLLDDKQQQARLCDTVNPPPEAAGPAVVSLDHGEDPWGFRRVIESGSLQVLEDLERRAGPVPAGAWTDEITRSAAVLPLARPGARELPAGFVVAGISPRLVFDDSYRSFLELTARQVAIAIARARAYEEERRRAEALAEIDRAKTQFFSNVSHEFRTPLTLMLGPIEDLLFHGRLSREASSQLEVAHRNSLRLLRLVNTVLDFSRIEAGRIQAVFQPTDLAALTTDLVSVFRAATERAGLQLTVDCPPLPAPVYVDRDMWEKVVLNLVSNAFKFTFQGGIEVTLRAEASRAGGAADTAVLRVRDSGVGIPEEEMPRLFERFHRVSNAASRTHEGTGIGLALVYELVRFHGGLVRAESRPGEGSVFTVTLPLGKEHLPAGLIGTESALPATVTGALPFVEEAARWLPDQPSGSDSPPAAEPAPPADAGSGDGRPRILIADDNADMRLYLSRLLAGSYQVEAVADGRAALEASRRHRPDLVLSDVMMPHLDGLDLVRELRADPELKTLPIILLSARAGEDSRIDGVQQGADDYLIKPFSARELLARVAAHLEMARLRREAEDQIRDSERRLRTVIENSRDGINLLDLASGRYVLLSPAQVAMTGFTAEELNDLSAEEALERVHPEDREISLAQQRLVAAGQDLGGPVEYRWKVKCGEYRWFSDSRALVRDEQGRPVALVGISRDITAQKRAEEQLRQSEIRYRLLHETMRDGFVRVGMDGTIVECNELYCQMLGYGCDELKRLTYRDLTPERWHAAEAQIVQSQILTRGYSDVYEKEYRRKDGTVFPVELRTILARDDAGQPQAMWAIVRDITERKRDEERLRQAQKLESVGLLASGIAHDFNNLLVGVVGNASLVEELLAPGHPAARLVGSISRAGEQMAHLTRQLLAYSGKGRYKVERLKLSAILPEMAGLAQIPMSKKIALRLELDPAAPALEADRGQIQQVFMNLALNAAEAIGTREGVVTVRTGAQTVDAGFAQSHPEAKDLPPGEYAVLEVSDTGCGMDEATRARIFDPFFSTKFIGRGLGLAAVSGIVRSHHGAILVRSTPGLGSTFMVLFPAAAGPARDAEAAAPRSESRVAGVVVVIDDEAVVRDVAWQALERSGYTVLTAESGPEAIDLFKRYPGRIDLAVLDLSMPGLSGEETLPELRRIRPGIRVLVSSGFSEAEAMKMFAGQPVSGFVQKPYTAVALAEKVKRALE